MAKNKDLQRSVNFLPSIRCAILDTSMTIGDKDISDYMRSFTYNFTRNNYSFYKHKLYEENSVDKILKVMEKDPGEEYIQLIVVQAYGNMLADTWTPLEQGWSLFRDYCNHEYLPLAQENKFLVMGHILDDQHKDRWFRLHEQCFVINYKLWKELGKPKFGDFGRKPVEVRQAIRSIENFHDSHTPKYIAPGPSQETINNTGFGWNFINVSLENSLGVPNFDEQARSTKMYLYPEEKAEQEEFKSYFRGGAADYDCDNNGMSGTKKTFLDYHSFTIKRSPDAMWVMNTETVEDVKLVPSKKPLKHLYSVAAGWKTFAFLRNWHPKNNVDEINLTYFDISQNALDLRKWMHEEWNPRKFNDYLDYLHDAYFKPDIGLISMYEDFDYESPNWDAERERAVEAYENSVLRIFGSMEEYYYIHDRVRDKPIQYIQANMLKDYDGLIDAIQPHEEGYDSVIWSSNYITTRYTMWMLSYEERIYAYKKAIAKMNAKNSQARLHSADWDGSPTRGMRLEELNHAYSFDQEKFLKWRKHRT